MALTSPLLNDNNIKGARYVLLNITCGADDITMDELGEITDYIQDAAGQTADIIKGYGIDETLGDRINVTLIATGFNANPVVNFVEKKAEKIIRRLDEQPVVSNQLSAISNQLSVVNGQVAIEPVVEKQEESKLAIVNNEPVIVTHQLTAEPIIENKSAVVSNELSVVSNQSSVEAQAEQPVTENKIAEVPKVETVQEPFMKPVEAKESVPKVEFEIVKKTLFEQPAAPVNSTPVTPVQQAPVQPLKPIEAENVHSDKIDLTDPSFIEEQRKKSQERIEKLKQLSYKLRTPAGINELENEPAYKRRNVELENMQHSSESTASRFTISEGEDKKTELKQNNSFLHDNVD